MTNILRNRWVQGGVAAAILGVIAFAYTTSDDEVTQETTASTDQPVETPEVVQVNSNAETTPAQDEAAQEQTAETVENTATATEAATIEND